MRKSHAEVRTQTFFKNKCQNRTGTYSLSVLVTGTPSGVDLVRVEARGAIDGCF
eukprot:SAG11_NODE_30177_length_303_cov_1.009804_1_plen_53_part_01